MNNTKAKLVKITVDIALYCVNIFLLMKCFKYVEITLISLEVTDAELVALVGMVVLSVMIFIFTSALTDTYLNNHIADQSKR